MDVYRLASLVTEHGMYYMSGLIIQTDSVQTPKRLVPRLSNKARTPPLADLCTHFCKHLMRRHWMFTLSSVVLTRERFLVSSGTLIQKDNINEANLSSSCYGSTYISLWSLNQSILTE